jgi:hypothetical protein
MFNTSLVGGTLLLAGAFACGAVVDAVVDEAFERQSAAKILPGQHLTMPLVYIDRQQFARNRFSSDTLKLALRMKRLLP